MLSSSGVRPAKTPSNTGKACETYFNDLTNTIFGQHRFGLEEMFYTVKEMRSEPTAQIARDLDRDYEAVLNFVHKVQDVSGEIDEFDLYGVCEADEVYVTAGEKGLEDEDGVRARADSQKGRGTFAADKPPVLTLVRRNDGRVRFLVCKDLQNADEDIAEYGDGSVILCTDGYTIYDDIEDKEEWTAIWPSLTPTPTSSVMLTRTLARTAIASFASGWRSLEGSRSTISRNTSASSD